MSNAKYSRQMLVTIRAREVEAEAIDACLDGDYQREEEMMRRALRLYMQASRMDDVVRVAEYIKDVIEGTK